MILSDSCLLYNCIIETGILWILIAEYKYDAQKDLVKKQKRTKTTKTIATKPSGESVIEESIEVSEPTREKHK